LPARFVVLAGFCANLLGCFLRFVDSLARRVGNVAAQFFAGLRREQQRQHCANAGAHQEIG
jgi:hypothetical protein